ncbi:MAG: metallophosphoesterase [Clostridia bacterium]|nr:metallophosphoesterase [Clostridia bacterium]
MKIQMNKGVAELTEQVTEITIPGLEREYTFVQVTDLHIACHEPGDSAEAVELAEARNKFWAFQAGLFADGIDSEETRIYPIEACELLAEHVRGMDSVDGVFFTGDTVDYPSAANFRRAKKFLDSLGKKCYIVPGNHDAIPEDAPDDMRQAFYELMGDLPEYFAEELDGFDILGFSDGFVKVTDGQVQFLEERLALGRPVIVLLHAPVYTDTAREVVYPYWGYNWMVGDPGMPEEKQTDANFRFRDLLCEHRDQVKAVITGHVHMASGDSRPPADGEVTQYTSEPAFKGYYRKIIIRG